MTSSASSAARLGWGLACAVVVWIVAAWVLSSDASGDRLATAAGGTSIASPEVLAIITSDRPAGSSRHLRPGPLRSIPATVEAAAGAVARPAAFGGDVRVPVTLLLIAGLSFGLSRRAPPVPAPR
jgi:hypothetical protein